MQKKDLVNNQIKIFIRISLVVTGFICILVSLIMPHFDNRLNIFQLKGIVLGISVITLYFIPLFKNKFYIFFLYSLFWGIILFFEWLNSLSIYYNPSHVPFFYKSLLFIYQALTLVLSVYFLISILYNILSLSKRYIKLIEIRNKLIIILFYPEFDSK